MIDFLAKIIKLNTVNVVGIVKKEHGDDYNVLTIVKKGSKIAITKTQSFDSFEELIDKIDSKLPILLVIDGKGVLNKSIVFNNEADINWQKNIDYNTIYFTGYQTETTNFISFCRKANIVETVEVFQKAQFQVLDVFVGAITGALLQPAIQKAAIQSGDLILEFHNEVLVQATKAADVNSCKEYTIGGDVIASFQLPLYGALLQFFVKSDKVEKTQLEMVDTEEVLYKKAFNYFGAAILIGFLTMLTLSFGLIRYYGTKTAELNLQSVFSSQAYKQIQSLEKQKEKQLTILNESGLMSTRFLSYFGYELMRETPGIITLSELNIIPVVEKEIKADKKINFESRQILLKGESINEAAIHNWVAKLRTMKWIKKFEIVNLKKDKKNNSKFEIKITIANV